MVNLKGLNVLIALPSVVCAVAIAACGSSGHKPSASSHAQSFLAFSECMRSHGVTAFPDSQLRRWDQPRRHGHQPCRTGVRGCAGHLPQAAAWRRPTGARVRATKAADVRDLGVHAQPRRQRVPGSDYEHDPSGNPTNYGIAEGIGDLWLLVPSTIDVNSPAFTKAAKACKFH